MAGELTGLFLTGSLFYYKPGWLKHTQFGQFDGKAATHLSKTSELTILTPKERYIKVRSAITGCASVNYIIQFNDLWFLL